MATHAFIIEKIDYLHRAFDETKALHFAFEYELNCNNGLPNPDNKATWKMALTTVELLRNRCNKLIEIMEKSPPA